MGWPTTWGWSNQAALGVSAAHGMSGGRERTNPWCLSSANDKVVRLLLLQHKPHAADRQGAVALCVRFPRSTHACLPGVKEQLSDSETCEQCRGMEVLGS